MAATILNTPQATALSVYVVRAFVQMHEAISVHKELARKFDDLERSIERKLATQDRAIAEILDTIRSLMTPPEKPRRPIGFVIPREK